MSTALLDVLIVAEGIRHVGQLTAHLRSRPVMMLQPASHTRAIRGEDDFYIFLPVWREPCDAIEEAIRHFLQAGADPERIWVITTERECPGPRRDSVAAYVDLVSRLTSAFGAVHVHCPDPLAVKADQLNEAVRRLSDTLDRSAWTKTLVITYDIDSRPSVEGLQTLLATFRGDQFSDVFQQCSRFGLLSPSDGRLVRAIADAGALRANRYVLSSELPKLLNRRPGASAARQIASAVSYAHLTGHGLGIRLSWLQREPLPARREMEDILYGLRLLVLNVSIVPARGTDVAGVSASLTQQFRQQVRWFGGLLAALGYVYQGSGQAFRKLGALIATSFAIAEWLGSVATIPALIVALFSRSRRRRLVLRLLCLVCLAELVSAEHALGEPSPLTARLNRVAAYPLSNTLFGLAGWWCLLRRCTAELPSGIVE